MENITWNEYKARSNALNGFRVTHYSALFHAAHCRVEIDGRDFQLAWDDRYSTKEWNNQVNQFKKEHLSNFVEITALVCEEIKTKLEDYKAELILVQAHLSTGLAGTDYNGAIANKANIEKMITIYTRLVSMLPVFNDDLTTEVQNIITVNEGLLEVETDFYKKRILENKINFYNRVLNNLPVLQEEKEVMCDELTKLSHEQLTIVKQVLTNLDHIVNTRFDEIEGFMLKFGLCRNALRGFDDMHFPIADMFSTWQHFSGCLPYPVLSEQDYDLFMIRYKNQYDLSTENGRLRIDLAKHCIQYIKSYFNIEG